MISSGLTIQKRGQFENGFPSTRERVRITERPNDQAANFNTSQYYPESIPLPGQVMPSQIRYHQIFGKSTTPDERNYFLTYGIAQNTLAKANASMKTQRAPKRERLSRQDMDMLEAASDEYMTVRHHLDPVDQSRAMEGVQSRFQVPRGAQAPSESTAVGVPSVVSGTSRDASMAATSRDEDMVTNTVLADVNDVLPNLLLSPTEDDHIQARTFGLGPPPPPPPPVVERPSLASIEKSLSSSNRDKGKKKVSQDDITAELKKGVTLRKTATREYAPAPNVLQDQITAFLAKRKSETSDTSNSNKMSE